MTTIVMKLDQKVKREGVVAQQERDKRRTGNKYYEVSKD